MVVGAGTPEEIREAVGAAYRSASPGDVVLLSPGCASFDRYANYQERGEDFRRAVGRLAEAERSFAALAKSHPELAGPHANLALVHRQAGRAQSRVGAAMAK